MQNDVARLCTTESILSGGTVVTDVTELLVCLDAGADRVQVDVIVAMASTAYYSGKRYWIRLEEGQSSVFATAATGWDLCVFREGNCVVLEWAEWYDECDRYLIVAPWVLSDAQSALE